LQSQIYLAVWQVPDRFWPLLSGGSGYVARTASSPLGVVSAIREAAVKGDPSSVVYGARPLEDIVANSIATQRLAMILLSIFFCAGAGAFRDRNLRRDFLSHRAAHA